MNKFGIKLYGNDVYEIDDINYLFNSINHQMCITQSIYKFRLIDRKYFSIRLSIKFKTDE